MPSKSKSKGNRFERECVNKAKEYGLDSKRAWGSDGRSLGLHPEVDLTIENYTVQCKVRKRIAKWLLPLELKNHIQLVKEDRGETYAIIQMKDLMSLLRYIKETKEEEVVAP